MEPQQHPQQQMHQQPQPNEDNSNGSHSKGNFLCRQSSSRWTPTTDQIRILKDLYYNDGIRSPSAEQIQKISARLREYGKIEGKNVFYWFQNHKARERQKKRFTVDMAMQRGAVEGCGWKSKDSSQNKFTSISPGICSPSSSSPGVLGVGQIGTVGYGPFVMEKSFRDFSITGGGGNGVSQSVSNNLGWVGVDPCSATYTLYDKRSSFNGAFIEEDEKNEEEAHHGSGNAMETLPLFPMHGEDISGFSSANSNSAGDWHYYTSNGGYSRTSSLELSLNSYTPRSPDSS